MGVPKFYNEFIRGRSYKGSLMRSVPQYVSSFSLDMNGLIHQCAQIVYAYGEHADPQRARAVANADPLYLEVELHNLLGTKLMSLVSNVQPQEILVLAVDGVAPQAKIQQQRQRRYRAALEKVSRPTIVSKAKLTHPTSTWGRATSSRTKEVVSFDSNAITPGTDFMMRLDNYIQRFLFTNKDLLPPKIIYSGHMTPGEGEHKIMDLMRSGGIVGNGAHVLYGLDADLILLSLVSPLKNIFLMREDIRDVVSIDNLALGLSQEMTQVEGFNQDAVTDFVLMSFLLGNDFLPHQPSLESMSLSIDTMMAVYHTVGGLTRNNKIEWSNLVTFLLTLQQYEPELLNRISQVEVKYPSRMIQLAMQSGNFDYSIFRNAWYQNALGAKGPYQLEQLNPTTSRIVEMSSNYLKGLNWVLKYYTEGTWNVDLDYIYQYHHTPLLGDLAVVAQNYTPSDVGPKDDMILFTPVHQMLAVLPPLSINLIPPEVRHLMQSNSPIIDMFPTNFIIERDGKNNDWQGVVILPSVDPSRLIAAVSSTTWTAQRAEEYSMKEDIVIMRPEEVHRAREIEDLIRSMSAGDSSRGGFQRGRGGFDTSRGRGGFQRGRGRGGFDPSRGRGRGRGGFDPSRGRGRGRGGFDPSRGRGRGTAPTNLWQSKELLQ
jgi:5'-3' exoribonuclease 1